MKYEEHERMVDRLLDETLSPQQIDPRPGLEERILANLHTRPAPRRRWQWVWVALAAVLIVVIGVFVTRRPHHVATPVARTTPAAVPAVVPRPAPPVAIARKARPQLQPRVLTAVKQLPRQQVFPSPVPLTAEERLMLALRSRHPSEVVEVAQAQQAERERIQKYAETGEAPEPQPAPARRMR